jgi:pimeloyl-ACP methyl ester carboxylesterase
VVRTADGITLATWDLGGQGPPILFLHATGFHGRCWAPLAAELSGSFYCWGLDQRGHGDSDRSPGMDYSWHLFSGDVEATIGALELVRPLVVGHSLGGGVALLTEALRPGTFAGIYAYEPIVLTPDVPAPDVLPPEVAPTGERSGERSGDRSGDAGPANNNLLANLARRRRNSFTSRAAAINNYIRKPPFAFFRADVLAAYVDGGFHDLPDGGVTLSCDTESEARVFEAAPRARIGELLVESATPTHLACGEVDPVISDLDAIARPLGGASTEVFSGLGHLGPFEDPRRVAQAITAAFIGPDWTPSSG